MVHLELHGDVWVMRMDDGENRFNRTFVDALNAALDQIESTSGACALVTIGTGKFYSNGLDLDWMSTSTGSQDFLESVYTLLGRILAIDVYTVAAVNGHAFAMGAVLASVHDEVMMRADRGYWCLPEIDLGLPLTPEMYGALSAHVPRHTLAAAALTGRRFAGPEAVAAGIANAAVTEDALLGRAIETAAGVARKDRSVLRAHKSLLYRDAFEALGPPET